jgi:hypothetical protein
MLTAAVRAIHDCCPGDFLTDVRTSCPDLWSNNPYITPLEEAAPDVHTIECHYPLIHQSNQRPYHFIHGFIEYLAERLHAPIAPLRFKGEETNRRHPFKAARGAGGHCPLLAMGNSFSARET